MRYGLCLLVSLCAALFLVAATSAGDARISPDWACHYMMQPTAHVDGAAVTYTAGKYTCQHNGVATTMKAVELKTGSTAGILAVHLIADSAGLYYGVQLAADERVACVFDAIDSARTTVELDSVTLFPE